MKKLFFSSAALFFSVYNYAQVGINTENPQTALDVNGSIQLRNELQVDGNPGTPGQIYFSQGSSPANLNDWKDVNVPFLEEGQYQLVNTYAVKDEVGIDFTGAPAPPSPVAIFNETFESNSPTVGQWTQSTEQGSSSWTFATGAGTGGITGAHGGSRNARFVSNSSTQITKLISPALNFSNHSSVTLSFWYGQQTNTNFLASANNELKVYYRTSAGGSWTQIWNNANAVGSWTQVSNLSLPNSSGTAYYQIAFEGITHTASSFFGTVNGHPNVLDDVTINGIPPGTINQNSYNSALSTLGETITSKNWTKIPGLDLDIKINDSHNKISMIYQTGVESRTNTGNDTGFQTEGNVKYMCGVFRKLKTAADDTAVLVALRGDQINNAVGKQNQLKSQSIYTLTYTVQDVPADEYTFSVACRRLSTTASESQSLLSIGNAVNGSGTGKTNNFMLNSVLKVDVIELVTVTGL